ncbi:hypothetical protein K3495_g1273 [Podosphaera aphanis]|nr:hypothetical protein K3495_g1273 [Podosphaera aphanis]
MDCPGPSSQCSRTTVESPGLVASTRDYYSCSIAESRNREKDIQNAISSIPTSRKREDEAESNYFKSTQWSPDGTTLITSSADNAIRTIIVPPTILSSPTLTDLKPYTSHQYPSSVNTIQAHPDFSLSEPASALYLSAPSSLPIRLLNAFAATSTPLGSYPLTSLTTEAYLTPASIVFPSISSFLTGTDSLIALFDLSRNGEGPVTRLPTIPSKRHRMKGGGVGIRGIISALAVSQEEHSTLAAGTWTRWIGLYDSGGLGGTVATWSVAEAADKITGIGGCGVSQVMWSACGRYLCVAERMSDGVLVFDVRVTGKLLAWLEGRKARTNQRLALDVFTSDSGIEVWAGGMDGVVRVWEGVGKSEGPLSKSWEWLAHNDPVTSTVVHTSGTVVATCSGQRSSPAQYFDDDNKSEYNESSNNNGSPCTDPRSPDNSLKIWSL